MKTNLLKALRTGTLARKIPKDKFLDAISSSGKSGLIGGTIDGALGAAEALKLNRLGLIDQKTAASYAMNEAACGFFTATAGTLGTTMAKLVIGSLGPTALVIGMGASVGARYIYRSQFDNPLPNFEEEDESLNEEEEQDLEHMMDILAEMGIKPPNKKKS